MNEEGDRYRNIGFYLSRSIKVCEHENFPGVYILEIVKDSFFSGTVHILLLLRSPNSSLSIFYNRLETFLSTLEMFDITIGDFNINVISNNNNIQQVMLQYQLINYEPAHISGSLLDHIYI